MTWIFVLAYVLFVLSLTAAVFVGVDIMDGADVVGPLVLAAIFTFAFGLFSFSTAINVERDCYHAGGQVVNTECVSVGGKVALENETEDR